MVGYILHHQELASLSHFALLQKLQLPYSNLHYIVMVRDVCLILLLSNPSSMYCAMSLYGSKFFFVITMDGVPFILTYIAIPWQY